MSTKHTVVLADTPSTRTLLLATAVALIVAGAILVAFVLPAEYGIDPLHTGRALGLTDLANANETPAKPAVTAAPAKPAVTAAPSSTPAPADTQKFFINPVLVPSPTGDAPTVKDVFIPQKEHFQLDSREMTLKAGEGMEIKYDMKKGAGLVYSWTADGVLAFEFHGDPDVKPAGREGTDYYESYQLDDKAGKAEFHGTFIAPTTGIHGWFWENKTGRPVTLKVVSAGYFDWIMQNRNDKHTALKPTDPYSLPSHPKAPDEVMK